MENKHMNKSWMVNVLRTLWNCFLVSFLYFGNFIHNWKVNKQKKKKNFFC